MKIFKTPYFIVLLILFTAISCVKQNTVDFSQANDLTFNQQTKTGFINFAIDSSVTTGVNALPIGPLVSFKTPFDLFNNTEFEQHLQKADLHFEIENTYDRDFALKINFLDINNNIKYSINLNAFKNTTTPMDVSVARTDILNLIFTIKANIITSITNPPSTNNDANAFLKLKSSATLYFLY